MFEVWRRRSSYGMGVLAKRLSSVSHVGNTGDRALCGSASSGPWTFNTLLGKRIVGAVFRSVSTGISGSSMVIYITPQYIICINQTL